MSADILVSERKHLVKLTIPEAVYVDYFAALAKGDKFFIFIQKDPESGTFELVHDEQLQNAACTRVFFHREDVYKYKDFLEEMRYDMATINIVEMDAVGIYKILSDTQARSRRPILGLATVWLYDKFHGIDVFYVKKTEDERGLQ